MDKNEICLVGASKPNTLFSKKKKVPNIKKRKRKRNRKTKKKQNRYSFQNLHLLQFHSI